MGHGLFTDRQFTDSRFTDKTVHRQASSPTRQFTDTPVHRHPVHRQPVHRQDSSPTNEILKNYWNLT